MGQLPRNGAAGPADGRAARVPSCFFAHPLARAVASAWRKLREQAQHVPLVDLDQDRLVLARGSGEQAQTAAPQSQLFGQELQQLLVGLAIYRWCMQGNLQALCVLANDRCFACTGLNAQR
jgi:hypothetical protein